MTERPSIQIQTDWPRTITQTWFCGEALNQKVGRLANPLQQVTGGRFQGSGQHHDVLQADIPLAPFHTPDIGAMQPTLCSEFFLRKPQFPPSLAYSITKDFSGVP